MTGLLDRGASKVPEVTLVFWIIKIAATTLGETGGDTVTMTLNWGYLVGTALFLSLLLVLVIFQIAATRFHPWLYWATIVASTTAGTTMADFANRSLGIGYAGGSLLLLACLMVTLGVWSRLDRGCDCQRAEGGGVLLGGDYVLADAGNGIGRLDRRRYRTWL